MLEEVIKRLTVAVLDLTAAITSRFPIHPDNYDAHASHAAANKAAVERIPVNMPFDRVPTTGSDNGKVPKVVGKDFDPNAVASEEYATETTAREYTADDARKALLALAAAKGKEVAAGVLKQFSAAKVTELAPQHWPEFIAACEGAL